MYEGPSQRAFRGLGRMAESPVAKGEARRLYAAAGSLAGSSTRRGISTSRAITRRWI
jgi:hypothetical protein